MKICDKIKKKKQKIEPTSALTIIIHGKFKKVVKIHLHMYLISYMTLTLHDTYH